MKPQSIMKQNNNNKEFSFKISIKLGGIACSGTRMS